MPRTSSEHLSNAMFELKAWKKWIAVRLDDIAIYKHLIQIDTVLMEPKRITGLKWNVLLLLHRRVLSFHYCICTRREHIFRIENRKWWMVLFLIFYWFLNIACCVLVNGEASAEYITRVDSMECTFERI